jgi:DNA modification methylase
MKPYYDHAGITIYHGNCLSVLRELPAASASVILTDPPYGIDYQSRRRDKSKRHSKVENDMNPFIWWLWDGFRIITDTGALLCFWRWDVQEIFRIAIATAGFDVRSEIVWDRQLHGMGDLAGSVAPCHDKVWFATKGDFKFEGARPTSVLSVPRLSGDQLVHPNEKPLRLLMDLLRSIPGSVLDPFMGSGTTFVAAKNFNRRAIGIEIEERCCEIAARRLCQETFIFE